MIIRYTLGLLVLLYFFGAISCGSNNDNQSINDKNGQNNFQILPPVGIENDGNDCYFNSIIQYMMNNQSFLKAAKEVSKKQPLYHDLIADYQKSQRENKVLSSKIGTAYRKFKNYLNDKHGGICPDGVQSDFNNSFDAIVADFDSYGVKSPFNVELINPQNKTFSKSFLTYAGKDGKNLDHSDFGREFLEQLKYKGILQGQFKTLPDMLAFQANLSPSNKIFSFVLPKDLVNQPPKDEIIYHLNYISIHMGGIGYGHYWCWVRINKVWYEVNDRSVQIIGNDEAAVKIFDGFTKNSNIRIMTMGFARN